MLNKLRSRAAGLTFASLLALGLIGCGDDDEGTTTTTTAESTSSSATSTTTTPTSTESTIATSESTTTTSESTTSQSTTPEATINIAYLCGHGDTGSAEFSTDDIGEIDDFVNATDLCEFKGGLIEISFTAPCPSGDRDVTVAATDGAVPDIATLDLCENR